MTDHNNPSQAPKHIWLLSGYRAGERNQILALGQALEEQLGWHCEIRNMLHRKTALRSKLLRGSDLSGINRTGSSPLGPPWPDAVITAGIANEPVARWIRAQSRGLTKIVHIGKPWADIEQFDLVITTPQYRLPVAGNVLHNELTLNSISTTRLQGAADRLQARLEHLPGPYLALVVGGNSGPYTLGRRAAATLARQACDLARQHNASLLVTTSARTGPAACEALRRHIDVPCYFYAWQADDSGNPYPGLLGLADGIIVTMDSIGMLSEACATGKAVYMFDLEGHGERRPGAALYRLLMRWAPDRWSRDIAIVHRRLLNTGRVQWLGRGPAATHQSRGNDMARAVSALRDLLG